MFQPDTRPVFFVFQHYQNIIKNRQYVKPIILLPVGGLSMLFCNKLQKLNDPQMLCT